MISLLLGFTITLLSLLIGFRLGKYQRVIPEDTQKKINQIFTRIIPDIDREVGPVQRPDARQNYLRDNPKLAQEQEAMESAIDNLNIR